MFRRCRYHFGRICSNGTAKPRYASDEGAYQNTEVWSTDLRQSQKMVMCVVLGGGGGKSSKQHISELR